MQVRNQAVSVCQCKSQWRTVIKGPKERSQNSEPNIIVHIEMCLFLDAKKQSSGSREMAAVLREDATSLAHEEVCYRCYPDMSVAKNKYIYNYVYIYMYMYMYIYINIFIFITIHVHEYTCWSTARTLHELAPAEAVQAQPRPA